MTDSTFHTTQEDIRKEESRISKQHDGNTPADSEPSLMKSVIDSNSKPKSEIIEERRANLPLPDDPPTASDWNSADATKVNVGSGRLESDISRGGGSESLRGPATSQSSVRVDGQEWKTDADEPSKDMGMGKPL